MKTSALRKSFAVSVRIVSLRRRHQVIKTLIAEELRRPAPCSLMLQRLKRRRLAVKDQIARLDEFLRILGPAGRPRQTA